MRRPIPTLVFLTGAQTSAYEAEVGKLFRGSYGTMFVDFPAVRSLIESLIAQNRLDQSAAASLMALSLFDTLEITGRTERQGELVLNMTDKDKNAAEVLYKTIEGFARCSRRLCFKSEESGQSFCGLTGFSRNSGGCARRYFDISFDVDGECGRVSCCPCWRKRIDHSTLRGWHFACRAVVVMFPARGRVRLPARRGE